MPERDHRAETIWRLRFAPETIPGPPWTPRVMLYADGITGAGFAGVAFAGDTDVLIVRAAGREWMIDIVSAAGREWMIDGESGVLMHDGHPTGIAAVPPARKSPDGWTAELVATEGSDIAALVAPGVELFGGPFPGWAAVCKFWSFPPGAALGWGFSPAGRTLVLVGPELAWSYARVGDAARGA